MTARCLRTRGPRLRLPGRDAGARRRRPARSAPASGSRSSARTGQRQVDARPPLQRAPPADRGPGPHRRRRCRRPARRRTSRRRVGLVFQDPDRQIFAGRVRAEVAFGPRNLGPAAGRSSTRPSTRAPRRDGSDKRRRRPNPYDLGYSRRKLLALASILAMEHAGRRPRRADDRPGCPRRRADPAGSSPTVAAAGRTVIAISHDMRFVAEAFERVVVMRDGRIVLDGTPAEVFAEAAWPTLASTFLEPPLAARIGARLGLGSTPTDAPLIGRARRLSRRSPPVLPSGSRTSSRHGTSVVGRCMVWWHSSVTCCRPRRQLRGGTRRALWRCPRARRAVQAPLRRSRRVLTTLVVECVPPDEPRSEPCAQARPAVHWKESSNS